MTLLDEVRKDREELARVLKKHAGIRRTVEDLYPDSAHFIYELLQNAEDAGATEARFTLRRDELAFEHDGRPFADRDVWAITDIGEGTKAGDEDKIGRFGLGFKAVFAYSETPRIWSPTYSFEIRELVLPYAIASVEPRDRRTRFQFPFNNPKKAPADAYSEVLAGLNELAETTLLFLRHLESVGWCVEERDCEVLRVEHGEHHVEILKQMAGATTWSSHFLRFSQPVRDMEKQRVAVAFELASPSDAGERDPALPISTQMRVVPANPGRVAVFFPAEKETSGLRFHLHAPFVPELSRASIKDTPTNLPLIVQLAELAADSLHHVRDAGLLTGEFLGVLPNPQDPIPTRYEPIRAAIVNAMNEESLVPTHARAHAPAKTLLHGKAALKDLLSEEELHAFGAAVEGRREWALSAAQRNSNADRFLAGLAITKWDVEELLDALRERCRNSYRKRATGELVIEPDQDFLMWLRSRPEAWHQQLYALLFQEPSSSLRLASLAPLHLVRRADGSYGAGATTFFPTAGATDGDVLPRVAEGTYSSGKSKLQQQAARKFLEAIGVRQSGESDEVAAVLEQRYTATSLRPRAKDLLRFIKLVEAQPAEAERVGKYHIFETADGEWATAAQVYLDEPVQHTGLRRYYEALGDEATRWPLASRHGDLGVAPARLAVFCRNVGVATQLEVAEVSCHNNPQWDHLRSVGGERKTSPINRDYTVSGLDVLLQDPTLELSRLVWRTMCDLDQSRLRACYQRNERHGAHYAASQLVHTLRNCAWVPQFGDRFVHPRDASKELLPEGFPFDSSQKWLGAVEFEATQVRASAAQMARDTMARSLGLPTGDGLMRIKRFACLPLDEQERLLVEIEGRAQTEFPDREPGNPERRAERVGGAAAVAPERDTESRSRSIAVGYAGVKQAARQYLVSQYTNDDGELVCQVCKAPMPFTLENGSWYFECVAFLPDLNRRHYQNYLALCPNHSAMFEHANGSAELMCDMLGQLEEPELEVVLARQDMTIRFTRTHLADLRSIIAVDGVPSTAYAS